MLAKKNVYELKNSFTRKQNKDHWDKCNKNV